jgi:tetratricopeptide (TPR) repeat protein
MPAALNNLAYMLSEGLNQVDEALPYATKAREVDPKDGGIADTLGWIFYRRGDYGRALPLLSESAGAGTLAQNPEVQYHLAMARYAIGDEAGARASFSRVIALNRSFAEAKGVPRRLAVLDLEPASPGAIETLEAAMKEGGNDFVAAMKLGQAYERAGAYEKARSAFERAARISPTSTKPLLFLASLNAGKLNDLPKALEAARAARKLAPNDPVTAGVLGRVSYRANDYAAALALLYEYARSSAADAESLYDLALSYYSAGQFDDARSNLRNYIAAARGGRIDEAKNLIVLMDFQAGKGDAGQSEKIASGRLQQAPDDPPALMTLGLVAQRAQKYPEAAQKFEQLLSANKAFSPAQRQLAMLYGEYLGNDAKAAEYGSKARTAFASDVQLAKVLGKVAYRRGEFGYATDLLAQTAKDPNADAETFYYLGMAYYKARQPVEAKNALKRALALNLDARLGAEASRVLKEIP